MNHGTFWQRLVRGTRWAWFSESHRALLPADLESAIMSLRSADRFHAKQGRSTARVRFESPAGQVSVYLKRHERLPWRSSLAALVHPAGCHSAAAREWHHLKEARTLGVPVPQVVGTGERIGPWGRFQSFLMLEELAGCRELNEILPDLGARLAPEDFERLKRRVIREMVRITTTLHRANLFHKDFYLCHFFLDLERATEQAPCLTLIDLHRLGKHPITALRWRIKDLGQLLFSTFGVAGIADRDRLRFWIHYRRAMKLRLHRWQLRSVWLKAARYVTLNH
jgi:heptose I phosphotransferase